MEISYGWKIGSCINIDAEKAGKELEQIGDQNTPEMVVGFAQTHKRSELYKHFDKKGLWDDQYAASVARANEARHLLNSITIQREVSTSKGEKEFIIVRAYENIKLEGDEYTESRRVYIPTETALSNPDMREQVIEGIRKSIFDLQEKSRNYETYLKNPAKFRSGIETAMDGV
jgi:hypothetical protein